MDPVPGLRLGVRCSRMSCAAHLSVPARKSQCCARSGSVSGETGEDRNDFCRHAIEGHVGGVWQCVKVWT